MRTINELVARLQGDRWRLAHPFSDDIRQANELLHNPAAFDDEIAECLTEWCSKMQPCQFGAIAAVARRLHFCILTHAAVTTWTDEDIAHKIAAEKRLWKQRAAFDRDRATHSFVLVVTSPHIASAAPDSNLQAFSNRLIELTGWSVGAHRRAHPFNEVSSDYLYLRDPKDSRLYGFQFNIDFFACAGHDRWWHDHRFPGGIAFTANSLGHMRAYREWYTDKKADAIQWSVLQAMITIDNAAKNKAPQRHGAPMQSEGRVTWLLPLNEIGEPVASNVPNPLPKIPNRLIGKDWTKYEGYLHTDHAVRDEFFHERDAPSTVDRPYRMDFTYMFARDQADFAEFTAGTPFTEEQVFAEIGRPEEWEYRGVGVSNRTRTETQAESVAQQLAHCHAWQSPYPER